MECLFFFYVVALPAMSPDCFCLQNANIVTVAISVLSGS